MTVNFVFTYKFYFYTYWLHDLCVSLLKMASKYCSKYEVNYYIWICTNFYITSNFCHFLSLFLIIFLDCFSTEYNELSIDRPEQHQNTHMKSAQQKFFCPEVTRVTSRCVKTPNLGHIPDCTQWTDLSPSNTHSCTPSTQSQSNKLLLVTKSQNPPQLPLSKQKSSSQNMKATIF